jgi:hypothetical protein
MGVSTVSLLLGEFLRRNGWLTRRDFRAACCSLLLYASCVCFGFGESTLLCRMEGSWGWGAVGTLCAAGSLQMVGGIFLEMGGWLQHEGCSAATCMLVFFGGLALNVNGLALGLVLHCGSIAAAVDVVSVAARAVAMLLVVKHMMMHWV